MVQVGFESSPGVGANGGKFVQSGRRQLILLANEADSEGFLVARGLGFRDHDWVYLVVELSLKVNHRANFWCNLPDGPRSVVET